MQTFKDLLDSDRAYIFDGAMGTMLYSKGIYINRSYDELNLVAADLVREVHSEYVRAGADIIETNTFGANVNKLQPYGLEANAREINVKAARIAREAAGDRALVAGAVGPLGLRIEPYGPTSFDEARQMFSDQISALLEGGVDLFVLETFSDISELHQAIKAVQDLCDLPIVAQVTIQMDGNTLFGATPEIFTSRIADSMRFISSSALNELYFEMRLILISVSFVRSSSVISRLSSLLYGRKPTSISFNTCSQVSAFSIR